MGEAVTEQLHIEVKAKVLQNVRFAVTEQLHIEVKAKVLQNVRFKVSDKETPSSSIGVG
ncbi:hypothetical protein T190_05705 [Sinorhizobium meliloti CCBAU 01290]|nr:hypothetical protein T190_05705 [Sinorhizobium meliloti CCBAU 01290]